MTGLHSPYEVPQAPDLRLETDKQTSEASAARVIGFLRDRGILG
jgi:adenylylsulfate kinase-like enzyme